ncbi:Gfo/Idh/MocA family oxidoreductase [Kribbella sp.]|uniref:Gfo/Idh/MocA family protein n=1 Tax=Kribbella sp. TaxID=1871183 RepID=UPI002D643B6F|nr:Gfo/Idh/MocA family oxidoreductase [Kribbella sp.]HZX07818.1 Gfo/Idh/MocA family oxidoreductase [Kribbella sp.]
MKRIAISGLGSIGRQHLAACSGLPDVRVDLFDPDPELLASARSPLVDRRTPDFDDLLAAGPDAVVLAGPDHTHIPQLLAALDAGATVLVEKPIAESVPAARAAVDRITDPDRVLVGYVLRHRPVVQRLRTLIADGAIGRPTAAQVLLGAYNTITVAASRFARAEPDRLYRDYSHEWDYLRQLFGPIGSVCAVARTTEHADHVEHPNLVDAMLRHDDVVSHCHIDYVDTVGARTLQVMGTAGSLFADLATGDIRLRQAAGVTVECHPASPAEGLLAQLRHLMEVVERRTAPVASFADGMAALEVADALRSSASSGGWEDVPTNG